MSGQPCPEAEPGGLPHGCFRCCQRCNLDLHSCPGCGLPLNHGVEVCLLCRNRTRP